MMTNGKYIPTAYDSIMEIKEILKKREDKEVLQYIETFEFYNDIELKSMKFYKLENEKLKQQINILENELITNEQKFEEELIRITNKINKECKCKH